MSLHSLKQIQILPIQLEEAWDFFSSPDNLNVITPPYMKFKVFSEYNRDEKIYPGMLINYKVSPLFNIPLNWTTEITAVDPLHYFIDEQRKGPFAFWHHEHFFESIAEGVKMTDIVSYRVPFGIVGDLVNTITIAKRVKGIFEFREKKLRELFEASIGTKIV